MCLDDHIKRKASSERILFKRAALMYNGEVQIFQEDLDRFLNVAQRLKLEGLLTDPEADQEEEVPFNNEDAAIQEEIKSFKAKPKPKLSEPHQQRVIAKVNTDFSPENVSKVDEQIDQNIVKNLDGTFCCKICGKTSGRNHRDHMKNHIETHLEGLCFNCPMCGKTFRSRDSLATHKSTYHKNNF